MRQFTRLIRYARPYIWAYVIGIFVLVLVDIAQLFIPKIIKFAVDEVMLGRMTNLSKYVVYILGFAGFIAILRFYWRYFIVGTAFKVERDLRARLFLHLETLSLDFFKKHGIGNLMAYATNDMDAIRQSLGFGTIILVDVIVLGIASFIFMIFINLKLTLFAITPFPLLILIT